jgi:anti-sigma regulatory factor (Ser/Thr protein kinase)
MIDLGCTRARLLAEIEATNSTPEPLSDITDPHFATTDVHARVCGQGREDLFPPLKIALSERFASVPRTQLIRDLLMPLKNALGNAFKHGNVGDPSKGVSVEIVSTRKGALLAVTDEGTGFDFAHTFRRFQEQETYFENHGSGFRNLHGAMSTVTYENGGRTVLMCFRPPTLDSNQAASWSPAGARAVEVLPHVLDGEWIRTSLSIELPEFASGRAKLESCRIYVTRGRSGDDCGNRYLLRVAGPNGGPTETRILTGRLHATKAAAGADFDAATRLHDAQISKRLRIPRPAARLAGEPRLVLYDFDSWMTLSEYLTHRGSLRSLEKCARKIGEALAALHRSEVVLRGGETDPLGEGLQARVVRAEENLQTLAAPSDLLNRFRFTFRRIQERAAHDGRRVRTPIHGALGWDCIHYGVDGRFYLYRFESCRRSDPGLDLGGFAADLLCFALANHPEAASHICLDDFLGAYNSEAAHPMSKEDLLDYTALTLVERLGRSGRSTNADASQLLAALDIASTTRSGGAKREGT